MSFPWRAFAITLTLIVAAPTADAQVTYEDLLRPEPEDWLTYGRTYDSQRHSPLDEIDKSNVAELAPAWIYQVRGGRGLEAVPLVRDGVMYVSKPNAVFALDGRSGRQIWQWTREPAVERGPNRGVALLGDLVYVGTPDAHLVALDAATGAQVWEAKVAEVEDGYYCPAAPFAIDGKVLMGVAAGDYGLNGWLDAFDAQTGELVWRWHTIPKPGEPGSETWAGDSWKTGGGGTWLTGSFDPELNLLYWGIGNPAPDFDGDVRMGDNLYTESVVALDADSGELAWHFQFTPHDVHDWDSVEIPILIDAAYEGNDRKLMLHADRNGFYYVLDRETGEFLHGTPFIDKLNWASALTDEGRPVRVPGVEPTMHGNLVCPSTSGATNWMSPAYNPSTGRFYLAAKEGCGISYKAKQEFRPGGFGYMATGYSESPADPWQMYVRSLDPLTGERQWEYEQVNSKHYGAGLVSTAGGLIFAGDDQGFLTALDAESGEPLWHFNTGARISASPIVYGFRGREYVAVAAGSSVVAFALVGR